MVGTNITKEIMMPGKLWTRPMIDSLLRTNPKAVERAMVVLFNRQTRAEQSTESTNVLNQRGFSAFNAKTGSYYVKWVMSGRHLTGMHLEKARKIAIRHSKQLVEEANA